MQLRLFSKKWLDEVLTEELGYGAGGDKMKPKEIGVAVSCGGKETDFSRHGAQRHSLAHYVDTFDGVAAFTQCRYIGFHAIYDTYNPQTVAGIGDNIKAYLEFLKRSLILALRCRQKRPLIHDRIKGLLCLPSPEFFLARRCFG